MSKEEPEEKSAQNNDSAPSTEDENKLIAQRRLKLDALRQLGQAYPNDFNRENTAAQLFTDFGDKDKVELAVTAAIPIRLLVATVSPARCARICKAPVSW